eukprot:9847847-Alexandrium_andersonii.AAC.1
MRRSQRGPPGGCQAPVPSLSLSLSLACSDGWPPPTARRTTASTTAARCERSAPWRIWSRRCASRRGG